MDISSASASASASSAAPTTTLVGLDQHGLQNVQQSCYVNAVMQVLRRISFLNNAVLQSGTSTPTHDTPFDMFARELVQVHQGILRQFAGVRKYLPAQFQAGGGQQDAQEFFITLWDTLKPSMPRPLKQLFTMTLRIDLTCQRCHTSRHTREVSEGMSLALPTFASFAQASSTTSAPEPLTLRQLFGVFFADQQVEVRCDRCEQTTATRKQVQVEHWPRVLMLHLQRFTVRDHVLGPDNVVVKNHVPVRHPHTLNVSSPVAQIRYERTGVIFHLGDLEHGHYRAAVRLPSARCQWIECDDQHVHLMAEESQLEKHPLMLSSVYMLFYEFRS